MTMSPALLTLLLVPAALAGFPLPKNNQLAQIAAAEPGATACAAAEEVVSACVSGIPDFTNAPLQQQEECLCCYSATPLSAVYGACVNYIEASATKYSSEAELFAGISSICGGAGAVCGGGSGAGPTTAGGGSATTTTAGSGASPSGASPTTATVTGGGGAQPPACTSFLNILSSCSNDVGDFSTAAATAIASCVCPGGDTSFDDYADTCASWASTADPTDYSVLNAVRTFCAADAAAATKSGGSSGSSTAFPASGGSGIGLGGGSGGSGSKSSNSPSTTTPDATVTVTPPTVSHSALAGHNAVDGTVAWVGSLLIAFLSFLFML